MITLKDIVEAEIATRKAGDAWIAAKRRSEDQTLDRRVRVEAGLEELDAREALTAASECFRAVLAQAVREAAEVGA